MPDADGYSWEKPDDVSMLPSPCARTRATLRRGKGCRVLARALAGEASPLLQQKPCIALGCHLRPLGPHRWSAVRTGEQEPGFAGNVRPHEPRVGLGPENLRPRLRDVLGPGRFRLGRGCNPRILMVTDITDAVAHPVHEWLGSAHKVADRGGINGEEIWEAGALNPHIGTRPRGKLGLQRLPAFAADLHPVQRPGHGVIASGK